ncbi:MAG: BatD family protein [Bacteroidota bacterium]
MNLKSRIWTIALLAAVSAASGQDETFKATAPAVVAAGEQFQYVIEGSMKGNVQIPSMNGFQLLGGPFSSYSSSSQWVNGKMTTKTEVTYTHILRATGRGSLTIPPATVRVGRKEYKTNAVQVTVNAGSGQSQGAGGSQTSQSDEKASSASAATDPVFLRVIPSKKSVYVGEQFVSGLKIYTRVNTRPGSSGDLPYEGFYKTSLDPDQSAQRLDIGGQQYISQVIQRHILIPQKSGEIVIAPYESEWLVQQRVQRSRSNSPFDSFFDDPFFGGVQEVPTKLATRPVTIHVKPLPGGAPEGFTGGVGDLSMTAALSSGEIEVNEALTLKITIRGTGNLPLMGEPVVNLPPDHDLYDVTRSLKSTTSGNRISGSVTFEYPIVARHAGRFRIAPIRFAWFDPAGEKYITSSTEEFSFTVLKGDSESTAGSVYIPGTLQESVEDLGTDIHDIIRTRPTLTPVAATLIGKRWFIALFLFAALLFILTILFMGTVSRRNADLRLVKNRKANRLARNRLKRADKYRRSGENDLFYEEIGKAIWGYFGDKLGIETSGLSRDVITGELSLGGVGEGLIREYARILDDSEFSRFAPSSERSNIDQLYKDTVLLIRNLENSL